MSCVYQVIAVATNRTTAPMMPRTWVVRRLIVCSFGRPGKLSTSEPRGPRFGAEDVSDVPGIAPVYGGEAGPPESVGSRRARPRGRVNFLGQGEGSSREIEQLLVLLVLLLNRVAVRADLLGEREDLLGEVEQLIVLLVLLLHS